MQTVKRPRRWLLGEKKFPYKLAASLHQADPKLNHMCVPEERNGTWYFLIKVKVIEHFRKYEIGKENVLNVFKLLVDIMTLK